MAVNHDDWDFGAAKPPAGLSDPVAAMWWLAKGNWQLGAEWETAHELCQRDEGSMPSDWVHGLAHWIEGDTSNAAYWYRRSGKRRASDIAREEWAHILGELD